MVNVRIGSVWGGHGLYTGRTQPVHRRSGGVRFGAGLTERAAGLLGPPAGGWGREVSGDRGMRASMCPTLAAAR